MQLATSEVIHLTSADSSIRGMQVCALVNDPAWAVGAYKDAAKTQP